MPELLRTDVIENPSLSGLDFCRAHSDRIDVWFRELFAAAHAPNKAALVAVGGYGRQELAPQSDLDVLLLHRSRKGVEDLADALWYPVWDEGLKLGHSVRTPKEALRLAATDLDTATALLDARFIAGNESLVADLADRAKRQWRDDAKSRLIQLREAFMVRHATTPEVAFHLEPDLKEGRGGLRDVQTAQWIDAAVPGLFEHDRAQLVEAYKTLQTVRVELHRQVGSSENRLLVQEQGAVADGLGLPDADALMAEVATAGRTISWLIDEIWDRVDIARGRSKAREDEELDTGIVVRTGRVHITRDVVPDQAPWLLLRAAVAAARRDLRILPGTLHRLAETPFTFPDPWTPELRDLFVDLLSMGTAAIPVIEALDHWGLFVRVVPEWEPNRSRPQRNAYHRFTVDRHLLEAAAEAAGLVETVDRADLLLVGALLHDIGKGYPGDHTEMGIELVGRIAARMGFEGEDVSVLVDMVRHHLLLPDVATRRDLSDDGTIRSVAEAVGSIRTLRLLGALTEADSIATGSAAWGEWKAGLVGALVERTAHVLAGGPLDEVVERPFPSPEGIALMETGDTAIIGSDQVLIVVDRDRPGLFNRIAGVTALNGLDVLWAAAYSADGMALAEFTVQSKFDDSIDWERVRSDTYKALSGRLALEARLAERAAVYRSRTPRAAIVDGAAIMFDNQISDVATVVDVRVADGVGVLYAVTRAFAALDLDIRYAKVQTLGHEVVDSFYIVDSNGRKIDDADHLAELRLAILHVV